MRLPDPEIPDLRRHIFHVTLCYIGPEDREDAELLLVGGLFRWDEVEGLALEDEDGCGYRSITDTRGLPRTADELYGAWRDE